MLSRIISKFNYLKSSHSTRSEDLLTIKSNWQQILFTGNTKNVLATTNQYKLDVQQSSILNAGVGVVCKGSIFKNQLVAFYSGQYFPPPPPLSVVNHTGESISPLLCTRLHGLSVDSTYQIHCNYVGGYIDGIHSSRNNIEGSVAGHLINHPVSNKRPNVRAVDFLWDDILSDSNASINDVSWINSIGSGIWYIDPTTFETVGLDKYKGPCAGIGFIAIEDIRDGEELLLDYKYDTRDPNLPAWYTPCTN